MNTSEQIEQQLKGEFDNFYNEVHKGAIPVPSNILELFKKAVMALAPHFHQVHASKIRVIASKTVPELTNGDIHDITKLVINTPLEKMYGSFDEAISAHIRYEKFILSFNKYVDEFNEKLRMRKATLENLSGIRNNNGANGGLHPILKN